MHKLELNLQTNELKEVALTQNEINEINVKLSESASLAEQKKIEEENAITNKQSAINKLKALGLTDAEVEAFRK